MVVWGWGVGLGFCGWGFQLMGFGVCGVGPSVFLGGWGSLYKHRRITLGKKNFADQTAAAYLDA